MFGDLLGNFQKQQEEMLSKTRDITVEAEVEGINVTANGNKEVINVSITDPSILADKEQLEDLLVVALNRALNEAGEKAAEAAQQAMEAMLPPGMGGLSGLFGK
jgi:nucleoid-associated protein EbfC